jgi:aminobenzoyl-glutamate utilization protein B
MKCAQAGALASETRMEFEQGTNYAHMLPNEVLADVLSRAMQKAGGFEYSADEQQFASELQKTLGGSVEGRQGPDKTRIPSDGKPPLDYAAHGLGQN